jgi:hypothetical protein
LNGLLSPDGVCGHLADKEVLAVKKLTWRGLGALEHDEGKTAKSAQILIQEWRNKWQIYSNWKIKS